MKVLYDAQIFRQQRYGGISRYFCELAPRINAAPDARALILAPRHRNAYLRELPSEVRVGWYSPSTSRPSWPHKMATRATELLTSAAFRPDVVHETYYFGTAVRAPQARRVLTVYDMIHERFPQRFAAANPDARAKRAAAQRADHVICISECTRRDVIDILGLPSSKVTVTHLSSSLRPPAALPALPATGGRPYLLYVGDRGGYKNFEGLLKALRSSTSLHDVQLVCYGGGALQADEWARVDALGLPRERITHCGGDDAMLAALYASALCLVYPSLYEGFGLPPLEAMNCGCPVVCSNGGSLPEVTGAACADFDPNDAEAMCQAIESVALSESRRTDLRAQGQVQAQRFSWDRCASETLAVYRGLIASDSAAPDGAT